MNLDLALRLHPAVKDWLHRLYSLNSAHGSALVEGLGAARDGTRGLSDNCRTADLILEALTAAGWIVPHEKPTPSASQVFFGVGGRGPGKRGNASNSYPQEYGYRPADDLAQKLKDAGLW